MKPVSLRIPDGFHSEVVAYAEKIGVSLNQLALVALADYLHMRSGVAVPEDVSADFIPDVEDLRSERVPVDAASPSWKKKTKKRRRH